jgi:hypothetical protein
MGNGNMAADFEKPDRLTVKHNAETEFHFHYNREERLKLKGEIPRPERIRRARVKKITRVLYVLLGGAIIVLVALFLFRIFD